MPASKSHGTAADGLAAARYLLDLPDGELAQYVIIGIRYDGKIAISSSLTCGMKVITALGYAAADLACTVHNEIDGGCPDD